MSSNVRFSAVLGTVLAALCFALWRTTRKRKNSARGSESTEISRSDPYRKPETSGAIEDAQPAEPPSSINPATQSEETENQKAYDVDQGAPRYSPSDEIGPPERQMAAAENADGVTGAFQGRVIAGTISSGHPQELESSRPSGAVRLRPGIPHCSKHVERRT